MSRAACRIPAAGLDAQESKKESETAKALRAQRFAKVGALNDRLLAQPLRVALRSSRLCGFTLDIATARQARGLEHRRVADQQLTP